VVIAHLTNNQHGAANRDCTPAEEVTDPQTVLKPSLPVDKEVVKPERKLCRLESNNAATKSNDPSTQLQSKRKGMYHTSCQSYSNTL